MTGNPDFDRLVDVLPQVERCHICGWPSPFTRRVAYYRKSQPSFLGSISVCMYCERDSAHSATWMGTRLTLIIMRWGAWIESVHEQP